MANDNITIYNGEGKPETTREMTDAEMNDRTSLSEELSILRIVRNSLLQETDYLASSDRTLSDNMKTYRQSLRDMTFGLDTIEKIKEKMKFEDGKYINFPVKPTE